MKEYISRTLNKIDVQHHHAIGEKLTEYAEDGWEVTSILNDIDSITVIFGRDKDLGECQCTWMEGRQHVLCGHPLPCPKHKMQFRPVKVL